MVHLIYIYFIVNTFIAAFKMGEEHFWWSKHKEDLKTEIIASIVLILFGGIIYLFKAIRYIVLNFGKMMDKYTQITFYWEFYFTDKYRNLSDDVLFRLNQIMNENSDEETYHGRLRLRCVELVNRRHKYRYDG